MCGHVGVYSQFLTEPLKKAFNDMLYLDVVRGEDSTGVLAVSGVYSQHNPITHEVFKSVGTPTDLYMKISKTRRLKCVSDRVGMNVLMGHNRFATQGKIDDESAHPFEFENIIGAHNGTVQKWSMRDFHGYKDYDIDSQIIFSHLNHTMDINKVWKDADGAMALVWWDKTTHTMNFIRNKERSLYYSLTKDDKALLWASERWMIIVACLRQGIEHGEVYSFAEEDKDTKAATLYTFKEEDGKIVHSTVSVNPFQKPAPMVGTSWMGHRGMGLSEWDDWVEYQGKSNVSKIVPIRAPVGAEWEVETFVDNPKDCQLWLTYYSPTLKETLNTVIYIGPAFYEDAKKKIIGHGKAGYYLCPDLTRSTLQDVDYYGVWSKVTWAKKVKVVKDENKIDPKVIELNHETAPWFDPAMQLSHSGWIERTACGCWNCDKVPYWAERGKLHWFSRELFICDECTNDAFIYGSVKQALAGE